MIASDKKVIRNHSKVKKFDQCLSSIKKLIFSETIKKNNVYYVGTINENAESHRDSFNSTSAQCKNVECASTLVIMYN